MPVNDALSLLLNSLQLRPKAITQELELACTVPGVTQMVVMNPDGSLGTQAIPTGGGGGGGGFDKVANKASLGDAATAGVLFRQNVLSGIIYVAFAGNWEPVSLAVSGTDAERSTLEQNPGELEVGFQFTNQEAFTSVWNGVQFVGERGSPS